MDAIKQLLQAIPPKNRVLALVVALAAGAGIFAFVRWEREQRYHPLYTSLAPEDAAAIIQKLKETGVDYRVVGDGTAIDVASDRVAEIRLQLASAGLPKTGRIGFELFDKTNFGATDFTEHVNYRRALEGELERSVMALSEVEHARVHLTFAKDSVYLESRQPAKASVLIRLRPSATLNPANVVAITHLISSAVEGLGPDAVSVLDMRGNLLSRPRKSTASVQAAGDMPDATLEYQQQIERSLLAKINSTLEPLLGPERFRAAVSVECDLSSGEQSEEIFDPTRSVMVSSQKTEDLSSTSVTAGIPGTAASLPKPESTPPKTPTGISRRTENVSYQSSRTVKRTRVPQGVVRRISSSVLVDHEVRWEGQGQQAKRTVHAPSPEQMKVIRDVIAGVLAFNAERGDQLIVESVPFEATLNPLPTGEAPKPAAPKSPMIVYVEKLQSNPMIGIGIGAGVLLLIAVGAGLMMKRRRKNRATAAQVNRALPEGAPASVGASATPAAALPPAAAAPAIPVSKRIEAAATHLREGASKDAQAYAGALAQWVQGDS
jgi:flagellar M-ring protein FliF